MMEPLQDPITLRNTIQSLRSDLASAKERIATLGVPADNVERWVKYTTMFYAPELAGDDAGTTAGNPTVKIAEIPANSVATGLRFDVPTLFSGGTLTDVVALIYSLGSTGGSIITGIPAISTTLFSTPTLSNLGVDTMILAGTSPTPITLPFSMSGGYGNVLVAGQLDTYIRLSIPGSTGTSSTETTLPST